MINTVILPVAGLGTRFLPATKAVAKELLPVVDKPLLQWAVEEAYRAGIRHVVLVNSPAKAGLERHLQPNAELAAELAAKGKQDLLAALESATPAGLTVDVVLQEKPLGLGHAVACAAPIVRARASGGSGVAIMLPDDFIDDPCGVGCLGDMVALNTQTGAWSLAVEEVPRDKTDRYGVVSLVPGAERITAMVEKPKPAEAPSNLAVVGRYLLPMALFDALEGLPPGAGGEIQLTDGIARLLASQDIRAHRFAGVRYDCGSKLGYAQANMALNLRDPVTGPALKAWLRSIDN